MNPRAFLLILALPLAEPDPPASIPSVEELEKGIIAARQSLTSGHLVLHTRAFVAARYQWPEQRYEEDYELWFGDRVARMDQVRRRPQEPDYLAVYRRIFSPEQYIFQVQAPNYPGNTTVSLGARGEAGKSASVYCDPRLLGIVAAEFRIYHAFSLSDALAMGYFRADRVANVTRLEDDDGASVFQINSRFTNGIVQRVTVCPSRDFAVLGYEVEETVKSRVTLHRVRSTYEEFGSRPIWFPKSVTFTEITNGTTTDHETVTVKSAEFGREPDSSLFTIEALKLPVGTVANVSGYDKYWDGEQFVTQKAFVEMAATASDRLRRRWFYVANALACAVGACFVFWRYFGRAKPGRQHARLSK
jgi:hypothetical protein